MVKETKKCNRKYCRNQIPVDFKYKYCGDCRAYHRDYMNTKRINRRKNMKKLLNEKNPENFKLRKCLRCRTEFLSEHVGNRLCNKCNYYAQNNQYNLHRVGVNREQLEQSFESQEIEKK